MKIKLHILLYVIICLLCMLFTFFILFKTQALQDKNEPTFYNDYHSDNKSDKENTVVKLKTANDTDILVHNVSSYIDYNIKYDCPENERVLINILITKINQYISNNFQSIGDKEIPNYPNTYFFSYVCNPREFFDAVDYVNFTLLYHVPEDFDNDIVLLNNINGNPQNEICYVGIDVNTLKRFKTEKDNNLKAIKTIIPSVKEKSIEGTLKNVAKYIAKSTTYNIDYGNLTSAIKGETRCSGYAAMFYVFCKELDIPCEYIRGTAINEPHAWNRIYLPDGSVRYYDITWYDNDDWFTCSNYLNAPTDFHDAAKYYIL